MFSRFARFARPAFRMASSATSARYARPTLALSATVLAGVAGVSMADPTYLAEQKDRLKNICKGNLRVNPTILDYLGTKKTKNGVTLDYCCLSGDTYPDSSIGIYAGDADSYDVFSPVFDAAILYYHGTDSHTPNMKVPNLKVPAGTKCDAKTTRIRIARNLEAYPFPTAMTIRQRLEVEDKVSKILLNKFGGRYYPIAELEKNPALKKEVRAPVFSNHDHYLEVSGTFNDWPYGRGVFVNDDRSLVVWIGEEDHLRIQTFAKGFNFQQAFELLAESHAEIEKHLTFAKTDQYGYMNACPTNCGTGMRSSIHVKFDKIANNIDQLKKTADKYGLAVRPQGGEAAQFTKGPQVVDISNKVRLGLGEADIITNVHNGILELLKLDQE